MEALSTIAFVLIVMAAMMILIFRDWRITAVALAVQYLGAFVMVTLSWPLGMAVVKLIVGWMATSAVALSWQASSDRRHNSTALSLSDSTARLFFRGGAGILIVLLNFILTPTLQARVFPQVDLVIIQGGVMIMTMALMQLGINSDPYLVIISLLSFLLGFEVIHAALEMSTLLTGLFVIVNLGLALIGAYFMGKLGEGEVLRDP